MIGCYEKEVCLFLAIIKLLDLDGPFHAATAVIFFLRSNSDASPVYLRRVGRLSSAGGFSPYPFLFSVSLLCFRLLLSNRDAFNPGRRASPVTKSRPDPVVVVWFSGTEEADSSLCSGGGSLDLACTAPCRSVVSSSACYMLVAFLARARLRCHPAQLSPLPSSSSRFFCDAAGSLIRRLLLVSVCVGKVLRPFGLSPNLSLPQRLLVVTGTSQCRRWDAFCSKLGRSAAGSPLWVHERRIVIGLVNHDSSSWWRCGFGVWRSLEVYCELFSVKPNLKEQFIGYANFYRALSLAITVVSPFVASG
ncbi:hypothetical protein YC2023_046220 [Brassica napus]